jgi:hypothetical protein
MFAGCYEYAAPHCAFLFLPRSHRQNPAAHKKAQAKAHAAASLDALYGMKHIQESHFDRQLSLEHLLST